MPAVQGFSTKESAMNVKTWRVGALAGLFLLAVLCSARAQDKVTDGGKAEKFKGKAFTLKEGAKAKISLTFPEGKEATVTVKSDKKTDVNLFIYDEEGKEVAKDDSPGPDCEIKFTAKKAGKYILEVVNLGKGGNKSHLKVSFKKK
jgi:hypothetical protein